MTDNPVRSTTTALTDNPTYLTINHDHLNNYAQTHADSDFELPEWNAPVFISTDNHTTEDVIDYFMIGNVLNFCFNDLQNGDKFATNYLTDDNDDPIEWDGAFGMWACLKKAVTSDDKPDILDAETLANLSVADAERIFEPSNGVRMPMLETRVEMLQETGDTLLDTYDGTFATVLDKSDSVLYNDGQGFIDRLVSDFSAYRDEWEYNGESVRFDKRAQLAATMLYDWHKHRDHTLFTDIDELTVFADYGIPIVLRDERLVTYHPGLAYIVDADTVDTDVLRNADHDAIAETTTRSTAAPDTYPDSDYVALADMVDEHGGLKAGSQAELELRAATVQVGEKLMRALNQERGQPVYVPHIDFFLWNQRREATGTAHLTQTTAY